MSLYKGHQFKLFEIDESFFVSFVVENFYNENFTKSFEKVMSTVKASRVLYSLGRVPSQIWVLSCSILILVNLRFWKSLKILKMWFRYFLTSGIIRHFLHTRLKTAGFMDAELKTWNALEFGTLKLLGKSLSKFDKAKCPFSGNNYKFYS